MRKLRIGIIDLVAKAPTRTLWARVMHANFASIMPQVIATWCEQEGHDVTLVCYTGRENIVDELPEKIDLVFIGAFTEAAQFAYALSNLLRSKGAVTVLGGPHARCYPEDAQQYFDYVLGFTDRELIRDVLQDCSRHRPIGRQMNAGCHPLVLPGVRERWKFIDLTLQKAPLIQIVPMIGSLGCPYSCEFCIDAEVPYQPLDMDVLKEDLRFLLQKYERPRVGWHDPNFGIRFDDIMGAIEEAVPPGRIDFIAECSLSLLSEPHVKRLRNNGFKALLPGIESWFGMGGKSKTGRSTGLDKVHKISEHINMIMRYVPYVQANFVLGLDVDAGPEPFTLTKSFLDMAPGAFPAYSLLTAFGQAAKLNLDYQRAGRILPFPFHFLNNNRAINVRLKNYTWPEFYDHVIDLTRYSCSPRMIVRRFKANRETAPRWLNVVRAVSTEGFGRLKYYRKVRHLLASDPQFRRYYDQETDQLPEFFIDQVRNDLGPLWQWLPDGALYHDHNAYRKADEEKSLMALAVNAA